ncbi:CxxxxCH/CxxCH domain-containing protein [Geomonas propionica]|uniref:Cytochrome C n=1 Tax=Geomonas propionica TaxID=2798582 RepID=A0ABS0YWX0_9BACT|nr:CxxxxCH/CxxCH domain-containing protein [Geomonas propionica]MBJ6802485.1 cytochrome C [Geomonas propionica]
MGKVIVKNIRGMGWGARACLIAMFTMLATVLLLQMKQVRDAQAAVAVQTQWAILGTGTTSTLPAMTLAKGAGSNRLLVVKVVADYSTAITTFTPTVTYGGQTLTRIVSTDTTSRQKVWFGYLKEAQITAATSTSFAVTWNSTPQTGCGLSAAFYSNVDQTTPITGSRAVASDTIATTPTSGTINVTNGGTAIYGTNVNSTYISTFAAGYTEHFDTANSTLYVDAVASKPITATGTENPLPTWGTATRYGFASIGLNPATTTLGNGTIGTTANVAPGAASQKIDGFSLVTGSAGTTDTVTGLTVTTTNGAAIQSMSITNEAGTTTYFAALTNPGSDTWTFSGGTAIPVTNTSAGYKIVVTYKSRIQGALAGNTATTARVTALTSGNVMAGSDTADTTLTVINTHNPSTWGTNTVGNASVTLNWTYGTPGQSVVIIRYAGAKTDTTKPADTTPYSAGNPFGVGGTVRYVGNASTFTDSVGLTNGTTYYYKIFEYDTYTNYYNATDVWTAGLTPLSPDAVAPTVTAGFAATTPVNTLAVPITSFAATDNVGGSGVAGYMITTSATKPLATDAGWNATAPTSYTVAAAGTYTLYPWAKDGGGNVSAVYASPVTVVVDMTAPTVATFTVNTQSASRSIPIAALTGTDVGTSVSRYLITTTSTQPAAGAAGWSATAPTTFAVAADGSYTLYPWVKDAAGNVSAVSGLTRTVVVDTTAPTGLTAVSPVDTSTDQPLNVALQASTATDAGVGGVTYYFTITDGVGFNANSGWIAANNWAPAGLGYGTTYTWQARAKDSLGNQTALTTPMTFTTGAACVRNDPTLTLLTPTGGIASTISADGGTSVYNLKVINNDYGGCGATTFNLGVSDIDALDVFDPPTVAAPAVTLPPGGQVTTSVTVTATPNHISGMSKTWAFSAADAYHAQVSTGNVQTTLNVVACTPKAPLLIVGPDSGYLNRGGAMKYTVTVKNTDSGAGCSAVTYNLAIPAETNSTDFSASTFSAGTLSLGSGQLGSVTLTVSAKSTAAKNAINKTTVGVSAVSHTAPANRVVTSTVNNPMLHNSDSTSSTKWSANGGWGIPGARYGEFDCTTCHVQGGAATRNVNRIRETVTAPDTSKGQLPGAGQPINYRRLTGTSKTQAVPGWDSGATPRTSSDKICEICHTYDAASANGTKAHPYATTATLGNHFGTDGVKDCIGCHKHSKGFSVSGLGCTGCHGTETATITPDNRYVVAPPRNANGLTGTLTGIGQVSNDPKVGAHQAHLKRLNGFSNYSTIDFTCQACHGPLPTDFSHINSNSIPVFQSLATKNGAMTASYSGTKCNNTYCHNPAATGGSLLAANAGSSVFPSWTSAGYVASGTKSVANCSVCHKVPGVTGFEPAGTHSGMNTDVTDCAGCHGHNGDASGTVVGRRHMDGIKFGAGNCDTCHGYDVGTWSAFPERSGVVTGKGAHEKHIAYLKTRYNVTLTPASDAFGVGNSWTQVCGVCHNGASHNMGEAIPGTGRTISITPARQFGGLLPVYNGTVGTASAIKPKTCSNVDCHYKETPSW